MLPFLADKIWIIMYIYIQNPKTLKKSVYFWYYVFKIWRDSNFYLNLLIVQK
jgi:hypothetical protein